MRATVHEFPFSIHCPERFELKPGRYIENSTFEGRSGLLPLPPTVEDQLGILTEKCSVYSPLTVKIPTPGRSFGNWEDKVSLHYSPYRKEFNPEPNPKSAKDHATFYRNYRLTTEGIPRPLTKIETIGFGLCAVAPSAIVLGRSYSIDVTLIPTVSDVWKNCPEFRLTCYDLMLKAHTSVRIPNLVYTYSESTASDTVNFPLSPGIFNYVLVPNKAQKLNGMFPSKLKLLPPPTFTSFAAKRTYSLELKMTVSCMKEESKFKIKWPDIVVHPAKMEPGLEDAMRSIEDGIMAFGPNGQSGLPSYSGDAVVAGAETEELPAYMK